MLDPVGVRDRRRMISDGIMRKIVIVVTAIVVIAQLLRIGPDLVAAWFAAGDELAASDVVVLLDDDICRELPVAFEFIQSGTAENILVVRRAPSAHQEACRLRYGFIDTRTLALRMAGIDAVTEESVFFSDLFKNDKQIPELILDFIRDNQVSSLIFMTEPLKARRYGSLLREGFSGKGIRIAIYYPEDRTRIRDSFVENRDFYNTLFKETMYFLK